MDGCLHPTSLQGAGQQLDSQETASSTGTSDIPQGRNGVSRTLPAAR